MSDEQNIALIAILCAAGASIVIAGLGVLLHRAGKLQARGPALAWAIAATLPLLGMGAYMLARQFVASPPTMEHELPARVPNAD